MRDGGGQRCGGEIDVYVALAREREVEAGEAHRAHHAGKAHGLGRHVGHFEERKFLIQIFVDLRRVGEDLRAVAGKGAVGGAGDVSGVFVHQCGELPRHALEVVDGDRPGGEAAFVGEAVSVVIRTPEQAKEHIDGQNRVPKPKHERVDCAASVPAARDGAHAQHEKDEKAQRREDVQTFRDGEGHALAELSDRAPQRIREALRQGVHSASALTREQKGHKERKVREQPEMQFFVMGKQGFHGVSRRQRAARACRPRAGGRKAPAPCFPPRCARPSSPSHGRRADRPR